MEWKLHGWLFTKKLERYYRMSIANVQQICPTKIGIYSATYTNNYPSMTSLNIKNTFHGFLQILCKLQFLHYIVGHWSTL